MIEAVDGRCFVKTVFLKISLSSHENTCAGVSFSIKLLAEDLQLFLKKGAPAHVFSCEFLQNVLYTPILKYASASERPKNAKKS